MLRIRGAEGHRVAFDGLRLRTGFGVSEFGPLIKPLTHPPVFPPCLADFGVMTFPVGMNLESFAQKYDRPQNRVRERLAIQLK